MQARELYVKIWQELSRGAGADKSPAHIPKSTGRAGDEGYRLFSNDDQKILVCPACQWLAQLP